MVELCSSDEELELGMVILKYRLSVTPVETPLAKLNRVSAIVNVNHEMPSEENSHVTSFTPEAPKLQLLVPSEQTVLLTSRFTCPTTMLTV